MPTEPTDFRDDWETLRGDRQLDSHQARPRAARPRTNDPALLHFLKVRRDLIRRYDVQPAPATTLPINPAVDVTGYGAGAFIFGTALADAVIGRQWPAAYTYLSPLGFRETTVHSAIRSRRGIILEVHLNADSLVVHMTIVMPGRWKTVGFSGGQIMVSDIVGWLPGSNRRVPLILVKRPPVPAHR